MPPPEPVYPIITDVDEEPTTVEVVLADDPELRFVAVEPTRAVCLLHSTNGSLALAINDMPDDLEHAPLGLAETLTESLMTACRVTLTGRWATVQTDEDTPVNREYLGDDAGPRRMLLLDGFEHTEEHPPPATPSEFARVDDPWGWPPDR
jgi:hypothetical protein